MKKIIVALMLLLLPLQFVWAGAALACQHEPDPSAVHLGHHSIPKSSTDESGGSNGPAAGNDCPVCHLASVQPPLTDAVDLLPVDGLTRCTRQLAFPTSPFPDAPERPNWNPPA
ncbi:MAG: hypothetical protein IT353_20870 [Gemmatimonadaceae bacterium]|nr:hypothetical protein [Gemmatimonadaceae bacterium]